MRRTMAAACFVVAIAAGLLSPAAATDTTFDVLVFTRTTGFRHASITDGVTAVKSLGAANGFGVDHTEDPTVFTDAGLAAYEAVVFLNTTGTVLDTDQKAAFERYIRGGGGFVGVHSAADTEHDWPFYGVLLGGDAWFKSHPLLPQPGTLVNEAPDQPSTSHLPARWLLLLEEFYSFKHNPRPDVRVLLSLDETFFLADPNTATLTDPGVTGRMGDHPMTWCHDNAGGRSWYTAIGHQPSPMDLGVPLDLKVPLYADPAYRQHLLGGILIAARQVAADCSPPAAPAAPAEPTAPASTLPPAAVPKTVAAQGLGAVPASLEVEHPATVSRPSLPTTGGIPVPTWIIATLATGALVLRRGHDRARRQRRACDEGRGTEPPI